MHRTLKLFAIAAAAASTTALANIPSAHAEKPQVYTGVFSNVAVGGYDPVSFFTGTPTEGTSSFSTEYNGAEWRFVSQENLDRFLADPAAYAPQYGGYCAWAAAQGYTAKGDPKFYRVVDGKLYLNFNGDVQQRWEQNIPGFIAQADENWPGILDQ